MVSDPGSYWPDINPDPDQIYALDIEKIESTDYKKFLVRLCTVQNMTIRKTWIDSLKKPDPTKAAGSGSETLGFYFRGVLVNYSLPQNSSNTVFVCVAKMISCLLYVQEVLIHFI